MFRKLVWSDGAISYNWDEVDFKIIIKYRDFFLNHNLIILKKCMSEAISFFWISKDFLNYYRLNYCS